MDFETKIYTVNFVWSIQSLAFQARGLIISPYGKTCKKSAWSIGEETKQAESLAFLKAVQLLKEIKEILGAFKKLGSFYFTQKKL